MRHNKYIIYYTFSDSIGANVIEIWQWPYADASCLRLPVSLFTISLGTRFPMFY